MDVGDDARRLGAPLDSEDLQRPANPLIDRMRRNIELDGNLFGGKMLVDQQQAVELPLAEPRDTILN